MKNLKRMILAVTMVSLVSAGAFAQKREDRPPKPDTKVVHQPKPEKPPQNSNRGDKRDDQKKGKP